MAPTSRTVDASLRKMSTTLVRPVISALITSLQTAPVQAAQELGPERLGLRGADLEPEHLTLTVGVHADRHYYRHAHDATASRVVT